MNFFERQDQARRRTRRLLLLFALAVLSIAAAVTLVVLAGVAMGAPELVMEAGGLLSWMQQNPGLLVFTAVATIVVVAVASLVRVAGLREGGSAVARQLGGVAVAEDTQDPALRRLRNVVEEIAIAASVPVPEIFVLEQEAGINAFAAGYSPNDAAIAVTRGTLDRLNRNELQGVIAHEYSHVLNGDMRLNIHLIGLLFGILVLGIAGRKVLLHGRGSRDSRATAAIFAVAVGLVVIGYFGVFFGRLIKAGVSRQREFLADASAVQFTRDTTGLAGALKKIAGVAEGSRLTATDGEEVSHMLFGDGIGYSALMATHPPLLERIRALDPQFDAKAFAAVKTRYRNAPPSGLEEDLALGLAAESPVHALPKDGNEVGISVGAVVGQIADPGADDYHRAGHLHGAIPALLYTTAHMHDGAMPLLLAMLLEREPALRERQHSAIVQAFGSELATRSAALAEALIDLHPALRLPLASLAFPALRRRPRQELDRFLDCVDTLVHADGQVGLFEYCLGRMLRIQVLESLEPARHRSAGRRKLAACQDAMRDLFSVLADHGHSDDGEARRAFAAGVGRVLTQGALTYAPPADWVAALDRALPELDQVEPMGKQLLIEGLVEASSHDGRITVAEAELLRTVCACLHCPLPPVLSR